MGVRERLKSAGKNRVAAEGARWPGARHRQVCLVPQTLQSLVESVIALGFPPCSGRSTVESPRCGAQLRPRPSAALTERNWNIRSMRRLGRREWHKRSGFSKRGVLENAIYRYKTIIGRCMRSRT